jgi:DNA-binding MarR family transcriptional regulator
MSEQTTDLLNFFSKLLGNPKLLFAVRANQLNREFSRNTKVRRQGARGLLALLLKEDGLTNAEIAEKLDVRPSSVTNMVKQLEQNNFIERKQDEQDKRISRIYLTSQAHEKKAEQVENFDNLSEDLFANLTAEEILILSELIKKILENNQDMPEELSNFRALQHGRGFGRGRHHSRAFGQNPRKFDRGDEDDEANWGGF